MLRTHQGVMADGNDIGARIHVAMGNGRSTTGQSVTQSRPNNNSNGSASVVLQGSMMGCRFDLVVDDIALVVGNNFDIAAIVACVLDNIEVGQQATRVDLQISSEDSKPMRKLNESRSIRLLVAEHLKKPDLVRCLRVCRSWHDTYQSLVWKEVSVDKPSWAEPSPSQDALTPEALRSHCHFIKDLYIVDWPGKYPFAFPRMQALYFRLFNTTTPSPARYPAPFIRRNQSLVKLHFWNIDKDIDYRLWKALLKLPHLRELNLGMSSIQDDDIVRFWTICENLESLRLDYVSFPRGTTPHASMYFRNIRELQLYGVSGMEQEEQLRFISTCPNLEDLTWHYILAGYLENGLAGDGAMGGAYFEEFAKEVARKRWPRLTNLGMYGQWTEEDTCLIIEGMQCVKKIELGDMFGPLTSQALQRHFNNLVELEVETSSEVASKLLQNILCSCSALKILVGDGFLAKDVVEGKPWVCLSLESLSICFMFSDTEQHLQPLIFERLAKLTRLEYLYSAAVRTHFQEKYPVPLQFRLQSGLDALSGLWRMESFAASHSKSLGEDELRWMLVHWKNLISVSADVDIDDVMKIELENLFKSRGIELRR
ncbi:hypothetical protein EDD21DRAFT_412022 [Dissophora ornata]|nr:hypothetical protein EDD21DRAFT_412022 [Dissophora ornata]